MHTKCSAGHVCRSNYCGGCHSECVLADAGGDVHDGDRDHDRDRDEQDGGHGECGRGLFRSTAGDCLAVRQQTSCSFLHAWF